jgi:flagellar basal body-associated protein FliL
VVLVTALVVVLVLIVVGLVGYMVYASSQPDTFASDPPPTEEELLLARLDIAKVEKGIDLALSKQETRMASARTKEAIAEALEGEQ